MDHRALWKIRLACACIVAAVCACGPAKPVMLYAPASVTIDTIGRPLRDAKVVSRSTTFWEAMSSLDTGFVSQHPARDAERAFASALGLVMSGHTEEAAAALDSVRLRFPDDSLIRSTSRILMTAMLQFQDKWKRLSELEPGARRDTSAHQEHDKADVESWAKAFKTVATRELSFPKEPVSLPLLISASGIPMIPVSINGREHILWLDTGSSMSIIASDVAKECAVAPLVKDTLEVATTTGRVSALPASIAHLSLGGIEVRNATAMIVDADLMMVRLGDGKEDVSVKIDGVIGFDIMSRLNIRIDYVNNRVTFSKPDQRVKLPPNGRNLFWIGSPVVRLVSSSGVPLHFHLDTGAQETYSTEGLVRKTRSRTFAGERKLIGGFSGLTVVHGRFIDEVHVSMAGQRLAFKRMLVLSPAFSSFVALDGVLGSDIGKGGIVRIDATNGLFVLEPRPRSLRPKS